MEQPTSAPPSDTGQDSLVDVPIEELPNYRTRLCGFTRDGQECPYKSECAFAHSEDELKENPFFKTKMCQNAQCTQGAGCRFAHSPDELRPLPDRSVAKLAHTKSKRTVTLGGSARHNPMVHGDPGKRVNRRPPPVGPPAGVNRPAVQHDPHQPQFTQIAYQHAMPPVPPMHHVGGLGGVPTLMHPPMYTHVHHPHHAHPHPHPHQFPFPMSPPPQQGATPQFYLGSGPSGNAPAPYQVVQIVHCPPDGTASSADGQYGETTLRHLSPPQPAPHQGVTPQSTPVPPQVFVFSEPQDHAM